MGYERPPRPAICTGRYESKKRAVVVAAQVPFLIDPNTGVEMFESAEIVEYLEATYGLNKA